MVEISVNLLNRPIQSMCAEIHNINRIILRTKFH
jgi:hypothetical protein